MEVLPAEEGACTPHVSKMGGENTQAFGEGREAQKSWKINYWLSIPSLKPWVQVSHKALVSFSL
jgi:hypothetical protein